MEGRGRAVYEEGVEVQVGRWRVQGASSECLEFRGCGMGLDGEAKDSRGRRRSAQQAELRSSV